MANRAEALDWQPHSRSAALAELVSTALTIADEAGLDAVSIRSVAARTGRRPMSIYTHVASKDDLLALMFDDISAELLVPGPLPADGRELLRRIAQRAFDAYLAHPWMLHAFGRRPASGPNQLRRAEQSATAVKALGIEQASAWTALSIVHEWTMGHALHAVTLREDVALGNHLASASAADYPNAARALEPGRDHSDQRAFNEALETVLDGIEHRFLPSAARR